MNTTKAVGRRRRAHEREGSLYIGNIREGFTEEAAFEP